MLGRLIRRPPPWRWSAYGKHPSFRDFLRIGNEVPLSKAFSGWMERGFEGHAAKERPPANRFSWRFWTKEARENHVVCGMMRDSTDAVGRPYPLLIMGSGPLDNWGEQWDLLPFACENVWAQMEYLSTRPCKVVKSLEAEVIQIKAPAGDWSDFSQKDNHKDKEGKGTLLTATLTDQIGRLSESEPFLCLDGGSGDLFELILLCHKLLRKETSAPPNLVFMGGTVESTFFAPFKRALNMSDFGRLWSLGY